MDVGRITNSEGALKGLPRCPKCGSVLHSRLLGVEDEDSSEPVTLLLLDCPRNDFHATVTRDDVVAMVAVEVERRLKAVRL